MARALPQDLSSAASCFLLLGKSRPVRNDSLFLRSKPHPEFPEVRILVDEDLSKLETHELRTAARYARWLALDPNASPGQTLLLLPSFKHRFVPGFDGVVFDATGRPVANVSFKSRTEPGSAASGIRSAFKSARNAATPEVWRRVLAVANWEASPDDDRNWIADAFRIFGIPTARSGRPLRIVADIVDVGGRVSHGLLDATLDRVQTDHELDASVVIFGVNGVYSVTHEGIRRHAALTTGLDNLGPSL